MSPLLATVGVAAPEVGNNRNYTMFVGLRGDYIQAQIGLHLFQKDQEWRGQDRSCGSRSVHSWSPINRQIQSGSTNERLDGHL